MRLFDNDATTRLTDRERKLLEMLGRCVHYLADLNGCRWIAGGDIPSADMRQRAAGLQKAAGNLIDSDSVTRRAMYGDA